MTAASEKNASMSSLVMVRETTAGLKSTRILRLDSATLA